jgi:hypothetical protein
MRSLLPRLALVIALGGLPLGCELIAGVRDLEDAGEADGGPDVRRPDAETHRDGEAGDRLVSEKVPDVRDSGSGGDVETSAAEAGAPIVVLQHHICTYSTQPNTFACPFPAANVPGNAFLVHFYFNYGSASVAVSTLNDDDKNSYAFLDVGDVDCPAGELGDQICCTMAYGQGTCEGWALATDVAVAADNPATVTYTITGTSGTDVMGAEVFEISGLAKSPLEQAKAMGTSSDAATVSTPSVTTTSAGDLIIAGFAAYSAGSTMTAMSGWTLDQDPGYFAAAEFKVGGPAGSKYTVSGAITDMAQFGTSTILALKAR